jgi:hypothetical protein
MTFTTSGADAQMESILFPVKRTDSVRVMRIAIALVACLAVSGCGGMAKAARETGQTFDRYGCLAKDFKGEPPCEPAETAAP